MKKLYLGTDPKSGCIHYPVIKIVPLNIPSHIKDDFSAYTHLIFTSKNAVEIFMQTFPPPHQQLIVIGQTTAAKLAEKGFPPQFIAHPESQEGIIELLRSIHFENEYLFYPRSSQARKNLENFMIQQGIQHQVCDLYETVLQAPEPRPDLASIDEIIFTSPSTVKGFIAAFGALPKDKKLTCIGPITEEELNKHLYSRVCR